MAEPPEIRYARSGRASIAYAVYGRGTSDLLVINGFVNHLELGFESASARHFFDRLGSLPGSSSSTSAAWGSPIAMPATPAT